MAIDKERHDKGEQDFLYSVGVKLNESRRKKKLKQHDVVSILEEQYQYKTSAYFRPRKRQRKFKAIRSCYFMQSL